VQWFCGRCSGSVAGGIALWSEPSCRGLGCFTRFERKYYICDSCHDPTSHLSFTEELPDIISFLDAFSHLYKRVCPSVGRSVRHTRVEFPRNGPNSNKIASGIRKYAIWKTIQRQVRGQLARTHLLSELCSTCFLHLLPLFLPPTHSSSADV